MSCPLCLGYDVNFYVQDAQREYFECRECHLIYVKRDQLITEIDEKSRYELHENTEDSDSYRKYLTGIKNGIIDFLAPTDLGLDFGCGESQLLAKIFRESGILLDSYDFYFFPNSEIFSKKYDFIVMSEVIEHLRDPEFELSRLLGLLNSRGKIFIKTKLFKKSSVDFMNWYYKNDPTHIQFFRDQTLSYLASRYYLSEPKWTSEKDTFFFSIIE